jgi:hypothetical protein
MKFPTSDVNGAKGSDFICTPLTASLARSKTRAFVIFSCLGAALLECDDILFFARVFGLGEHSAGSSHTVHSHMECVIARGIMYRFINTGINL